MRKLFFLIALFLTNMAFASSHPELNQYLQEKLNDFRLANNISSATLTVRYPDETQPTTLSSGTVAKNSTEPANATHLFQMGSITKSFMATLILKLQTAGYLSLDDRLELYLPEYSAWKDVTIRQLLNHTSGIYNYTDAGAFRLFLFTHPHDYLDANHLIDYAKSEPNYFKPGSGWHYSNTNYILLGKVIERVKQQPLDEILPLYLQETVHLPNTFFIKDQYEPNIAARMLHGYYQINATDELDITDFTLSWLNAAGGLVGNGSDLTEWIQSLFNGKFLNQNEFDQFTQLVSIEDGQPLAKVNELAPNGYGLGIRALQTPWQNLGVIWWHSGGTVGYKSLMMWLPQQKIAVSIAYTQVLAGKEAIAFDPTTPFAQTVLYSLANLAYSTQGKQK